MNITLDKAAGQATKGLFSDHHLAASIGKGTIFGLLANVVQVGTRFVTVPIVIHHLGLGGYGIWSIIMATASYMRFGTAGVKSAFQKYVAETTCNGDYETANKLLSTGSFSLLLVSLIGLVPLAIYSQQLARMSGVPPEFLGAAAASITLLALIMVASNYGASFEAVVMGAHRIDLTRTFNIFTTTGEAVVIIVLLHFGYGLLAMAATMGVSELVYLTCCYLAARRVLPDVHVNIKFVTTRVLRELIRFAGSYQLVNILELLYGMLLPVTVLKYFGADTAGVYALASRVVQVALMAQDAMILPLLSGGTMMFASGSPERIRRFFQRAFKTTIAVSLGPLAFVGAFGTLLILAWTGEAAPEFRMVLWLGCLAGFFQAISRVQLILYRASGHALHDNLRQACRLAVLVLLALIGRQIGFYGVLIALAVAELSGVVYMFAAMKSVLHFFSLKSLFPDTVRLTAAAATTIGAGLLAAAALPAVGAANVRVSAVVKLTEISLACLAAMWPAVALTKAMSGEEQRALLSTLTPWRRAAAPDGSGRA